jgi:hypothetical protein
MLCFECDDVESIEVKCVADFGLRRASVVSSRGQSICCMDEVLLKRLNIL